MTQNDGYEKQFYNMVFFSDWVYTIRTECWLDLTSSSLSNESGDTGGTRVELLLDGKQWLISFGDSSCIINKLQFSLYPEVLDVVWDSRLSSSQDVSNVLCDGTAGFMVWMGVISCAAGTTDWLETLVGLWTSDTLTLAGADLVWAFWKIRIKIKKFFQHGRKIDDSSKSAEIFRIFPVSNKFRFQKVGLISALFGELSPLYSTSSTSTYGYFWNCFLLTYLFYPTPSKSKSFLALSFGSMKFRNEWFLTLHRILLVWTEQIT